MPFSRGACCHDHDCEEEDCGASFSLYTHIDIPNVRCLNEEVPGSCKGIFRRWEDRTQEPASSPEELRRLRQARGISPPTGGGGGGDASGEQGARGGGGDTPSSSHPQHDHADDLDRSARSRVRGAGALDVSTPVPYLALRSDGEDPELLLHIPFDGAVTLRAIVVVGGPDGRTPSRMRAYANRDDLDFAAVADLPPQQEWELAADPRGVLEYPVRAARFGGVHSLTLHFRGTLEGAASGRGLPGGEEDDESGPSEIRFLGIRGEFASRSRRAVEAVYEARPVPQDHKARAETQGGWGL